MTAWMLVHSEKAPGYRTLVCRCERCGKLAAVVMLTDTLARLVRDPGMLLLGVAGSKTLRTGRHPKCQSTKEAA
jgi:hypothetical protein